MTRDHLWLLIPAIGRTWSPDVAGIWKRLTLLFAAMLVGTVQSGCRTRNEPDQSLLSGVPCAAPCWYHITPRESTAEEVRQALSENPYVRLDTVEYVAADPDGWPAYFAWPDPACRSSPCYVSRVYLHEDLVSRIELYPHYDLTLGAVVTRFGSPDRVHAALSTAEFWRYIVVFDYPHIGLTFTSVSELSNYTDVVTADGTALLTEDLLVTRFDYYAPTTLRQALADAFRYPPALVDAILEEAQEWRGFGRVELAERERW